MFSTQKTRIALIYFSHFWYAYSYACKLLETFLILLSKWSAWSGKQNELKNKTTHSQLVLLMFCSLGLCPGSGIKATFKWFESVERDWISGRAADRGCWGEEEPELWPRRCWRYSGVEFQIVGAETIMTFFCLGISLKFL